MRVDALDFVLPPELVASEPVSPRDASRMLALEPEGLADRGIRDLPGSIPPALFVVNDTRVLPARVFGEKPTGGRVELLFVERLARDPEGETWLALARASKPLAIGGTVALAGGVVARVVERRDDGSVAVHLPLEVERFLEAHGEMPLPPYVDRPANEADREQYQTTFASVPGAVAAPTAGLHFTPELVERMRALGHRFAHVTLHVGPGTFRPVKVADLDDHAMHEESYDVPEETARAIAEARASGRPVIAIGTTVVRTLESVADEDGAVRAGPGRTRILIQPPYRFRVVEGLLTNFHLPRSTLLALVMAFAGVERTRAAYAHAVAERYRFFSYGDAMWIPPGARR